MTQTDIIGMEVSKREGKFSSEHFHAAAKMHKMKPGNVTTILRRLHAIGLLEAVGSVPQKTGGNPIVIYQKVPGANFVQKPKAPPVISSYFVRDRKGAAVSACLDSLFNWLDVSMGRVL